MSKQHPILFSSTMVKALLEGRKTQTRRIIKPRKDINFGCLLYPNELAGEVNNGDMTNCPWRPDDILWVRENGWERPERTTKMMREGADTWPRYAYDAEGWSEQDHADFKQWGFKRRPSIYMPRWASRITLKIVGVRAELLQEISEEDAREEGAKECDLVSGREVLLAGYSQRGSFVLHYRDICESINGRGSWNANPWVWVISFCLVAP